MQVAAERLWSAEQIADRVAEMGREISRDYADQEIAIVGLLKGSFVFMADLIRQIRRPARCGFIEISRSRSSEKITEMVFTSTFPVEGAELLLVDDILDTGITLAYLRQQIEMRGPRSVRIATLLDKPARRRVNIEADYVGFKVPDRHIVGYGLDHEEKYRNLPYLTYVHEAVPVGTGSKPMVPGSRLSTVGVERG